MPFEKGEMVVKKYLSKISTQIVEIFDFKINSILL